eukprot:GHVU01019972.1.p1 GENE.GHVU01019972.1~~GHVU01019972.1.p1  ORF type:complete len:178 (+),score=4.84 GHVU01019972.1:124-657(+)
MIRNYYTEAYKGGIVPTISAANLIDGTAKVTETVAQAGVANAATSRTFTLANLNTVIKRGMYLTATAGAGGVAAITINDNVFVEAVTSTATLTTVTLNKPTQTALAQALTFFSIAQSSWKEYNLYIGTSPAASTISVLTSSNQELTLVNPAAGFVLPVSVVQITAVTGGLTDIIALD